MEGERPLDSIAIDGAVASPSEARDEVVVDVPRVPRNFEARKAWIIDESRQSIQLFAVKSKRAGGVPNLEDPRIRGLLDRVRRLFTFLEHDFEISPRYRDEAKLSDILKLVFDNPSYHFPDDLQTRAHALYEDFEANDWGAVDASSDDDEDGDENFASPASRTNTEDQQSVGNVSIRIRLPPPDHPIWGIHGIMHGVCPKTGVVRTTQLDRRYLAEKRSARVFGHNGLVPGAWFPSQLLALFHGAHGARMAGIHGNAVDGTYSVVVAGLYQDVDKDHGDIIYYSGPNSRNHTGPVNPPGGSASYLERSLKTGRPVRVLRAAHRKGTLPPSVGIRYDGLYQVTGRSDLTNAKGGLFVRYVLERQDGQEALSDITKKYPTRQQRNDFDRIKEFW